MIPDPKFKEGDIVESKIFPNELFMVAWLNYLGNYRWVYSIKSFEDNMHCGAKEEWLTRLYGRQLTI